MAHQKGKWLEHQILRWWKILNWTCRHQKPRVHLLHEQLKPVTIHDPRFPQRCTVHQGPKSRQKLWWKQHVPAVVKPLRWLTPQRKDVRKSEGVLPLIQGLGGTAYQHPRANGRRRIPEHVHGQTRKRHQRDCPGEDDLIPLWWNVCQWDYL